MLEYIWIENYRTIKQQGFNFNPNVNYTFNPDTNVLKNETKTGLPDDFFQIKNETVKSVGALIGANGTGKSTVLEFILTFLNQPSILSGFVLLNNQIISKSERDIRIADKWSGKKPKIINKLDLQNSFRNKEGQPELPTLSEKNINYQGYRVLGNVCSDVRVVYYSGEMNLAYTNRVYQSLMSLVHEFESSYYTDISDIAMLSEDQNRFRSDKAIYSGENPILTFRRGESERLLDLMLSNYSSIIPFSINSYWLNLAFSDIDSMFFESYDEIAFVAIAELLENIVKDDPESKIGRILDGVNNYGLGGFFEHRLTECERKKEVDLFELHFYHYLLMRHLREQIMETIGELTHRDKLTSILELLVGIENYFFNDKPYIHEIKSYLSDTIVARAYTGKLNIDAAETLFTKLSSLYVWEHNRIILELKDKGHITAFFTAIQQFRDNYGSKYSASDIFDIDLKGLSTGEKQFLKLFSRFLAFNLNNKNEYITNGEILLLIDEFDIGFHPLWQRRFLHTIIKFLEEFVNSGDNNRVAVQLIITSHSPFLVSDLPKECINFLYKPTRSEMSEVDDTDKHSATFGANIHELYSDSFFLENAHIGDFAKNKIDEAFKELSNEEPDFKKIETIIRVIGEPILKIKLAEMLANTRGDDIELSRLRAQQDYINERISQITEKEKNDKDK